MQAFLCRRHERLGYSQKTSPHARITYGCPKKVYLTSRDVFRSRVKAMKDPHEFRYGLWGFEKVEVDILRGIIFVRYVTGWWERDK